MDARHCTAPSPLAANAPPSNSGLIGSQISPHSLHPRPPRKMTATSPSRRRSPLATLRPQPRPRSHLASSRACALPSVTASAAAGHANHCQPSGAQEIAASTHPRPPDATLGAKHFIIGSHTIHTAIASNIPPASMLPLRRIRGFTDRALVLKSGRNTKVWSRALGTSEPGVLPRFTGPLPWGSYGVPEA
ncbi:hypothetical protein K438DRAFT_2001422 [Mycena galopus ATCC 62051]|nr:hypothetical protein K438DRAFT_2001422 [Mycena galopus ATCC 62051]